MCEVFDLLDLLETKFTEKTDELKREVNELAKQVGFMGKDIKIMLGMFEASHKRQDEFEKVLYKGNGKPPILSVLAVHSSWIKWWGGVTMAIIVSIAIAYFQLSAAPPVVTVDVTSSK